MLDQTQGLKLYQEILLRINDLILEDKLSVGDRLPSERELAERLKVGRSSVREALRALELLGLISTKRGEGTFIQDHTSHRLVEILSFFILRNDTSKKDLLETRKIIELDAVRLAAERIDQDKIEQLEKIVVKSEIRLKKGEIPIEEDYLFHQTIALATNNSLLFKIWRPIVDFGRAVLKESLERTGRSEISVMEHKKILKALKEKNVQEAEYHMKTHLEKSEFYA